MGQRNGGKLLCTLKREAVNGQAYRDRAEAEASIGAFIEEVYNRQRLHSALTHLAPQEFEVVHACRHARRRYLKLNCRCLSQVRRYDANRAGQRTADPMVFR